LPDLIRLFNLLSPAQIEISAGFLLASALADFFCNQAQAKVSR